MQSSVRFELSEQFFRTVDEQLAQLEIIERRPVLIKGVRAGLNLIKARVRQILPKPGYPGDKPGLKALRDTVSVKVKEYPNKLVGIVGYEWGAGSHGHIVEHGHRIAKGGTLVNPKRKTAPASKVTGRRGIGSVAGRVEGKFYLQKAVDSLGDQVESVIVDHIDKAIAETWQ